MSCSLETLLLFFVYCNLIAAVFVYPNLIAAVFVYPNLIAAVFCLPESFWDTVAVFVYPDWSGLSAELYSEVSSGVCILA